MPIEPATHLIATARSYAAALLQANAELTYAQGRQLASDVVRVCNAYSELYAAYTAAHAAAAAAEAKLAKLAKSDEPAPPARTTRQKALPIDDNKENITPR
jgi:hypothetical protein